MALQISPLFSYVRVLPRTRGPLSRVRADFQAAGVKFKHLTRGSSQLGEKQATSPERVHINVARRAGKFLATAGALWKSSDRERRGWIGKVTLGVGLAVSTVVLIQSVHTRTPAAMDPKVNLKSTERARKDKKDLLSVEDRRPYSRSAKFVQLSEIPVWSPTSGGSEPPCYQRNEKLDQKISLYSGDITTLKIDAIVNAANNTLLGGGGVDGAIHAAAGPLLKKECASLHGCETGEAKITSGYDLPAKYVIHTVGPTAHGGVGEQEKKALRSCYKNSLKTATENAARSVAFPCISTGIYGYPPEQAVHEALATVREYLDAHHDKLDRVIFCVFLPKDKKEYEQNLPLYFPAAPSEAALKSKL